MKKLNRKFTNGANRVLAGILALLGFSACEKHEYVVPEYGSPYVNFKAEYGTPYANFKVMGKVTDSRGNGLQGIMVTVPQVDIHQRATQSFIPGQPLITDLVNDTLYTEVNGNFTFEYAGFPVNDSINVKLKFEDIAENNRFETDSTKVTFFSKDLKGGDKGWFAGSAEKAITVQLKEKSDDLITGKLTEIELGKTVEIADYGVSLRVESINDCRCPIGSNCKWEGNASVEFKLTTTNGEYNFTLDTHQGDPFRNDTVIEGIKYQLKDVLPYPVHGEEPSRQTVNILVVNHS